MLDPGQTGRQGAKNMGDAKRDQFAKDWDTIVIGSGIGGMAAAAALTKTGHKVLLLEQYDTLGGLTHSFSRDSFTWDVGIHYLGGLAPDDSEKELLDWLCATPMEFASMGAVYDTLHVGDSEPLRLSRPYEAQELDFKARFPEEAKAIEGWTHAMRKGREALMTAAQIKSLPAPFGAGLKWWKRKEIDRWCSRTTDEVARSLTENEDLIAALTAQWGDFGGRPSTASFALHAMAVGSYLESGAWYPVGGGAAFAEHILPTITAGGGAARAGVKAASLLMEDGRVAGVVTADGETIRADIVISNIGARETVDYLLPDDCGQKDWVEEIQALDPNVANFSLFLGFEGDVEAAGATRSNHWIYPTGVVDALWDDAPDGPPPGIFVSFASLKDPAHDPGPNQKHVGEVLALTDWSTVERWAMEPPGARGAHYREFKERVEQRLFDQFENYFPELAKLVVHRELATPLTMVSVTGHSQGAFYGRDVTPKRLLSKALRMKTPIKGLYLSGQDVCAPGIAGALWGGVLAAANVDPKIFTHLPTND
jgi:all-trans-retinol 13,14-reductase